jgi:RND superfamily putative drug exporter
LSAIYGRAVRWLRWPVALAWIAGAALATAKLPSISQSSTGSVGALIPKDAAAVKAEELSSLQFGFPLLSRTMVVERDPRGFDTRGDLALLRTAARTLVHGLDGSAIRAALPAVNDFGSSRVPHDRGTTALVYLFIAPGADAYDRTVAAQHFVHRVLRPPPGGFVGVTGEAPARVAQTAEIIHDLPWIELATLILVLVAVGARFRAPGAPLITLAAVAVAYAVASRVVAWAGTKLGFSVPEEIEPVMVVLLFGVVTDYSVFFLSRSRTFLSRGMGRLEMADRTTTELAPVVLAAGAAVAGATLALLVAKLQFFRVFGPGLAFSVAVAVLVALTFVPALLAIFGSATFWPRAKAVGPPSPSRVERRSRVVRFACHRPVPATLLSLALLAGAASGLHSIRLGNPVIRDLPSDAEALRAYRAAARGMSPGMIAPTVIVVTRLGITAERQQLARLQHLLGREPGVDLVVGPSDQPLQRVDLGAVLARSTSAARFFVVLHDDPLGARAIATLSRIRRRMPTLLNRVGLPRAHAAFAGDTALSAETIDKTVSDLWRIAPAALAAIFIVLAMFLRALVAPLYLVLVSLFAFAAALGLTTYVFQDLLGYGALTYYVVFATAVLLVSLGSDYNVFLIGRIWEEAHTRPIREAVPVAASAASRSITLAGLVLAGSFALLCLVPLRSFYEVACVMTTGLLIDALLVRTILVPALVTIVGDAGTWPRRRGLQGRRPVTGGPR